MRRVGISDDWQRRMMKPQQSLVRLSVSLTERIDLIYLDSHDWLVGLNGDLHRRKREGFARERGFAES